MGGGSFFKRWGKRSLCLVRALLLWVSAVPATEFFEDFTELSLEELADITVTSVSKKEESLTGAATAIFVLSGEEIRRSGATSIPEALRLVPGLHVARTDAHTWAITARGFNGTVSDKLEVLMDGRSLYTPFFSGVFWDAQDTFMEDIDRIEVIRGPGATIWGANAVNGVINIVTKTAAKTQGLVVQAGAGNELEHRAAIRYGGELGDLGNIRAYVKSFERDVSERADGGPGNDGHEMIQAGFRADWKSGAADSFNVQGDIYDGELGNDPDANNPMAIVDDTKGYNLMGAWTRTFSNDTELTVQAYVDHTDRFSPGSYGEERDTYNIDFTHQLTLGEVHSLTWGGGYRRSRDRQENPGVSPGLFQLLFLPAKRTVDYKSLFVQDQWAVSDRLTFTLGSKFEDNDFSGGEVQPSARFAWRQTEDTTYWGAVSKAVRIPNRLDQDLLVNIVGAAPDGSEDFTIFAGNRNFDSEELIAYEFGFRTSPRPDINLDLAFFFNDYDDIRGVEANVLVNNYTAESYGAELSAIWQARDDLKLWAGYSMLDLELESKPGSMDIATKASQDNNPRHQALLRAEWSVSDSVHVGGLLRFVDELRNQVSGAARSAVSSYTELDLRVAWAVNPQWEFALIGQNLLDSTHAEFGSAREADISTPEALAGANAAAAAVSQVERSLFATFTWRPSAK